MRYITPSVYLIAASQLDTAAAQAWLRDIGAASYTLSDAQTDAENIVALAGKRCYMSFAPGLNPNVTKVRSDMAAFIENILQARHGSVLEHVTYTFAIENVSRVFTAEMNRHRAGMAISEGSLRYIRFDDLPFVLPPSLRDAPDDAPETRTQKERARAVFDRAVAQMESNYKELTEIFGVAEMTDFHCKKVATSIMRRIIGMGVATGGAWTGNLRALRHILTVRCAAEAEEEIAEVCGLMLTALREREPHIFGDFAVIDGAWQPNYRKV